MYFSEVKSNVSVLVASSEMCISIGCYCHVSLPVAMQSFCHNNEQTKKGYAFGVHPLRNSEAKGLDAKHLEAGYTCNFCK